MLGVEQDLCLSLVVLWAYSVVLGCSCSPNAAGGISGIKVWVLFPSSQSGGFVLAVHAGRGINKIDAIGYGSSSSSVAPTFRVTTSRRPSVMAYLAGACVPCSVPGSRAMLTRSMNSGGDPVSGWVPNLKIPSCTAVRWGVSLRSAKV